MMLRIKVIPRSSRSEIAGALADGTLKIRVAAPPEKGKANDALIALLAAHYGVARTKVKIVSGHGTSRKLVEIAS
ncbi:MAG TPA: DUF167 domain-containing protein [Bryobacteraceae bacterium]|nr:DUF167 domain-containing protein [Bryobacteraceae bacterium]